MIPYPILVLMILSAIVVTALVYSQRPLPPGLNADSGSLPVSNVRFLNDLSWVDANGKRHAEQQIFDTMLEMVGAAENLLLVDMFLLNDFAGDVEQGHRPLSSEFTDAVTARMAEKPNLQVVILTDPFNTFYGSLRSPWLEALENAGATIIITNLDALPDSNPLWSGFWRLCCQWLPDPSPGGWLPNPVGDTPVTLRSLLRVLNFKANHRKTLIADWQGEWHAMVASGNIHDASSLHSNVALTFSGPAALALMETEQAVTAFSGHKKLITIPSGGNGNESEERLHVLTEAAIRNRILALIDSSQHGERLDLILFYFSHQKILARLIAAHQRGVKVRVILDPNRDAFGREKSGIPNRQTAMRMHQAGIKVRWCNTHGEQCHDKILIRRGEKGTDLLLGSANFTRRNLDNFNLETSVHLETRNDSHAATRARRLFERRWLNQKDHEYTLDYAAFADHSRWRYWRYRVMEGAGLSSF